MNDFLRYYFAGYTFLSVETTEETRFMRELNLALPDAFARMKKANSNALLDVWWWGPAGSIHYENFTPDNERSKWGGITPNQEHMDPSSFMADLAKAKHPYIAVLSDVDWDQEPVAVRRLKEMQPAMEAQRQMVIWVQVKRKLPVSLAPLMTIVEFELPTLKQLQDIYIDFKPGLGVAGYSEEDDQKIVQAGQGLGQHGFENALALVGQRSKIEKLPADRFAELVFLEKAQGLKESKLEHLPNCRSFEEIGGLARFKDWIRNRKVAFGSEAKNFNLKPPKGVLMAGVRGCGKTVCAEAVAKELNVPLFLLDVGALFGGIVGESERNVREVIKLLRHIGPCAVVLDEIEKGLPASSTGGGDSGTSSRVMATFLNWMSTKEEPCFLIGTCNDINKLPPELLRKGRFDEVFFVDVPTMEERRGILKVMFKKYNVDPVLPQDANQKAKLVEDLVNHTLNWTGAELESLVTESLISYLAAKDRQEYGHYIHRRATTTKPQAEINPGYLEQMRQMANGAMQLASEPDSLEVGFKRVIG